MFVENYSRPQVNSNKKMEITECYENNDLMIKVKLLGENIFYSNFLSSTPDRGESKSIFANWNVNN